MYSKCLTTNQLAKLVARFGIQCCRKKHATKPINIGNGIKYTTDI